MMDSGQLCIFSVTPAMKKDFIELHPADFAAHCGSTYDKPPLQRLMDAGRLLHGHITRKMLDEIGPQLTAMVKKAIRKAKGEKNEMTNKSESEKFDTVVADCCQFRMKKSKNAMGNGIANERRKSGLRLRPLPALPAPGLSESFVRRKVPQRRSGRVPCRSEFLRLRAEQAYCVPRSTGIL
jgi:hypothetical protein